MTLRSWLEKEGMRPKELAESLGVSEATVSRWINDVQSPRIEQAIALEKLSGGKVPVEVWAAASARRVG